MRLFIDRADAGKLLAESVLERSYSKPLVLAIPRGGVATGFEIADALKCPLDTIVARKIGTPFNPEFAVGAIAQPDILMLDDASIAVSGSSRSAIEGLIGRERTELNRRVDQYKSGQYAGPYVPKTVIVVDDGIATGHTAHAALESVRKKYKRARIVFASPVCIGDASVTLGPLADDVICLSCPNNIHAISQAYESFPQLEDMEVRQLLDKAKRQNAILQK
jgi:putative phosphoribosyl transferase